MTTSDKSASGKSNSKAADASQFGQIKTKADLKAFLQNIRDKMTEEVAAPLFAASAMNHVLNLENVYDLLGKENKEIARDIWLRLKQSGLQLRNPSLLFTADEAV